MRGSSAPALQVVAWGMRPWISRNRSPKKISRSCRSYYANFIRESTFKEGRAQSLLLNRLPPPPPGSPVIAPLSLIARVHNARKTKIHCLRNCEAASSVLNAVIRSLMPNYHALSWYTRRLAAPSYPAYKGVGIIIIKTVATSGYVQRDIKADVIELCREDIPSFRY